jgi:hypothetical protein
MKKQKPKKQTWNNVKRKIKDLDNSQLVELLKDLYKLADENKNFLHARFNGNTSSLENYKKIILDSLYLDVLDESDNFDFEKADKAIKAYSKATIDNEGAADLMVYYVECGNKFTLDYGDINEAFYDTLIEMYEKAVKAVCKLPKKKQQPFRKRLKDIMESADGIGWGYYDDLCHFYHEAFVNK